MSYRGWLLAAVLLVSGGPLGAEGEFPIGAWFPGMIAGPGRTPTPEERRVWGVRLDSVKAQGFNTIHARQGRGDQRISAFNQAWMALAHARGLKVQLGSWRQPTEWRSFSRNYWTRVFEAEDTHLFTYATGREITHGDTTARYAATGEHGAGLLLASRRSVYLRRNPDTPSGFGSRFGHHVFRLKTDDASGTRHLATLRVLQRDRVAGVQSQDGLIAVTDTGLLQVSSNMTSLSWRESEELADSVSAETGRGDQGKRGIRIGKKLGAGVLWGSLSGLISGALLGSVGGGGAIGTGVGFLFGGVLGCTIGTTVGVTLVDPSDRSLLTFVGSVGGTVMTLPNPFRTVDDQPWWQWHLCVYPAISATLLSELWRYPPKDSLSIGMAPNEMGQWAVAAHFRL